MLRILHVDDSKFDFELISRHIEKADGDIEVEWAESADAALRLLADNSYQCILCDYQMPRRNGLELLKELNNSRDHIPFIFLTGQGSEELAANALRSGADDYFTKEASLAHFERLVNRIRQVIRERKERKRRREAEQRYEALFENSKNAIAIYEASEDGRRFSFVGFNKAAERIEHISRDRVLGRHVDEVFPGVERFGLLDVFRRVWATGIPESHPIRLYEDDRIRGWRENYVFKLPTGQIAATYEDISDFVQKDES